jgi:hypothetical protein
MSSEVEGVILALAGKDADRYRDLWVNWDGEVGRDDPVVVVRCRRW